MINWHSKRPALPPPAPPGTEGRNGGGGHSCSTTRSQASPPPPYLPAPRGSPRLPAVGSGAGGEIEAALGEEQGFKGPASSWVSPAQRGTAGAGWEGEQKDRSLSLSSASPDRSAERGCRPEWRGLGGKNETGKRQEGVFRMQDRERCPGRGIARNPSRAPTSPHPGRTDPRVGGPTAELSGCSRQGLGVVPLPAGSPSLTVASSAEFWAPQLDHGG